MNKRGPKRILPRPPPAHLTPTIFDLVTPVAPTRDLRGIEEQIIRVQRMQIEEMREEMKLKDQIILQYQTAYMGKGMEVMNLKQITDMQMMSLHQWTKKMTCMETSLKEREETILKQNNILQEIGVDISELNKNEETV